MTKIPPRNTGKTEWLEPPQWWKKVRPLRWLGGLALVMLLYSWLGPDDEKDSKQSQVVAVATMQAAAFDNSDLVSNPAPTEVPAPAATAEVATPPPTQVPVTAAPTPTASAAATATAIATATAAPPTATPVATAAAAIKEAGAGKQAGDPGEGFAFEEEAVDPGSSGESGLAEFTGSVDEPVRLVAAFKSYASVDSVVFELERAGFMPITEVSSARPRAGVPPRDLTTVTVSQFRHWNVVGKLTLQFFNDRLYQSEFEPEDSATYAKAQHRELPQVKSERSGRSVWIGGNLRIASSLDLAVSEVGRKLRSRPFLLWQDLRLVRQRDEWDRRFALAATGKQ